MLKRQVVVTSLGTLTVTSLALGELRQLDKMFKENKQIEDKSLVSLLQFLPLIQSSLRKVHQDLTIEEMESGLTLEDFNLLFSAVMEVSGLAKPQGEAQAPVSGAPV